MQSVVILAAVLGHDTAHDCGVDPSSHPFEPRGRRSPRSLGNPFHVHAETGRERFRQHDDVRLAGQRRDQRLEVLAVRRRVLPCERLLDECRSHRPPALPSFAVNALIRSAASSSVLSCFATQTRTTCSGGGFW